MNKYERARRATIACTYLKSRPAFVWKGGSLWLEWIGYNMKTGDPIPRSRKVRICGSHFDWHRRQPCGGNQGAALVYLAQWVRTGKIVLTVEDWERWCGHPVYLGNDAFLLAVKEHVYGVLPKLADIPIPTYCGCNELLENLEQLEAHVERGCWKGVER